MPAVNLTANDLRTIVAGHPIVIVDVRALETAHAITTQEAGTR